MSIEIQSFLLKIRVRLYACVGLSSVRGLFHLLCKNWKKSK